MKNQLTQTGWRNDGYINSETTGEVVHAPPHGRLAMLLAGLIIGIILLGIQLWMLTVALNQYLQGQTTGSWQLVVVSGLVLIGGIIVWRVMDRQIPGRSKEMIH
ncbi:hypothetical protein KDH_36280 [Dictyobacter sp. S3.2.2.5]|uniref:Uncharacterized protein n=1 Tax=Dictyobacter halimunensis TaxID=3026934 RepID=A0ABQ6FR98_9CHLR|nr:hypothetical protein KDH_36280 [Dictyobacter sp. S3.2.2.5]